MTDVRDEHEVRETLRPHERDPDAEPPQVDERDVTLALAALAGEVAGGDGATYAAEFICNLGVEKLNAMALHFYVTDPTFRAAFAAEFDASVRTKLRSA
jgi:hypothetical protein